MAFLTRCDRGGLRLNVGGLQELVVSMNDRVVQIFSALVIMTLDSCGPRPILFGAILSGDYDLRTNN